MSEEVILDITTIEETVTIDTTDPEVIEIKVVAVTGGASEWNELTGTADKVPFTTTNGGPQALGELAWLASTESLALRLKNGENLDLGEETVYHVQNNSGSAIAKGAAVSYAGTTGASGKLRVKLWNGSTDLPEAFMGLAMGAIATGETGYVTAFGAIRGVNTSGFSDGVILYANPTGTGLTSTKPTGTHVVAAVCINAGNNGTLLVRPTIGGYVETTDSRLSDARTPTAHKSTHATGGSDALAPADIGAVSDTDPRLSDARTPLAHTHGNISNGGAIGTTADLAVVTGTGGALTVTSRSGIDSRTSFPNADVTAASVGATPNTLVRRSATGSANFSTLALQSLEVDSLDAVDTNIVGSITFTGEVFTYVNTAASAHRTALGLTSLATTTAGTGVTTALAVNVGSAGAFVVNGGTLGTPSSGTLTNATGLPISTGVAGLGSGVATFLATPTSANLAAAVTDETGSEGLVFRNSPNFTGAPTINKNLIQQTCYKDGLIPVVQIFEDFPNGGTHPWLQGGNSGSGGHFNPSSNAPDSRAWGIQFLTTGAVATNTRALFLGGAGNWVSTTPIGASIQSCFCFANISNAIYTNGFQGGGSSLGVRLNSSTNQLVLFAIGITDVVLLSGLSLSSGNFSGGTRYRLFYRCISATQSEVYFASAPWNSSTWTTIYDDIITHSSIPFNWGASLPSLMAQTTDAVAKTAYVDWVSVIWDQQR